MPPFFQNRKNKTCSNRHKLITNTLFSEADHEPSPKAGIEWTLLFLFTRKLITVKKKIDFVPSKLYPMIL